VRLQQRARCVERRAQRRRIHAQPPAPNGSIRAQHARQPARVRLAQPRAARAVRGRRRAAAGIVIIERQRFQEAARDCIASSAVRPSL
jgi:hypothetical protein